MIRTNPGQPIFSRWNKRECPDIEGLLLSYTNIYAINKQSQANPVRWYLQPYKRQGHHWVWHHQNVNDFQLFDFRFVPIMSKKN
jgi:hypothetical protein